MTSPSTASSTAIKSFDQLQQLAQYQALTRARNRIVWPLAALTTLAYVLLILAIAFVPETLGEPIGQGVTSVGITLGLGMIVFCLVITGVYVRWANTRLEPLIQAVRNAAEGK